MRDSAHRVFECLGTTFDPVTGLVTRAGGQATLRHKTQRLLLHLIENRHRPVSREELIEVIWEGASVSEATVTGCLKEIRQALGDDAREPIFIRTLAKKGYWWVGPLSGPSAAISASVEPPLEPAPVSPRRRWPRWAAAALVFSVAVAGLLWYWARPTAPREIPWGELAWWTLDEAKGGQATERVHSWTAALPPGVAWTSGSTGGALRFAAAQGGVSGSDPRRELPRGTAPRTITAWVRTSGPRGDTSTIFQYGSPVPHAPADAFALRLSQMGHAGWANASDHFGSRRLDDGQWHFLAGVYAGGASRAAILYVDGVEETRRSVENHGLADRDATEWSIGRPLWGGTPFRGDIDDVRVYGHALTPLLVEALYRCRSGPPRLTVASRPYFFIPLFGNLITVDAGGVITNTGLDHAGVALAEQTGACALQQTRASNVGPDLRIEVELKLGGRPEGPLAEGGPFFRSRPAAAGDGILGGTSAGYWVQLQSNGQILVRCLHPMAVVAFSAPIPSFDPGRYHALAADVQGAWLEVELDGRPVTFDHSGEKQTRVPIPSLWETTQPRGLDRGAAGVAFSNSQNRGQLGGQQARNLRVLRR